MPGFGFEHGDAYSVHVGWSGNSVPSAERLPYTTGVIGGGELLFGGEVTLAGPGEGQNSYDTPWLFGSYGDGLNEISPPASTPTCAPCIRACSRTAVRSTPQHAGSRYFDHNFDTLKALADRAADSGVERFVVDDGWLVPAATTPPASVTGRLRRTFGPMVRSH